MLAMGLPLRPVNTPLAGAPDFGWDFAGWPVHTTVTTSATTRSEVGTIIPPALCRCDGHPLHLRARLRAIIPHRQENGAHPRDISPAGIFCDDRTADMLPTSAMIFIIEAWVRNCCGRRRRAESGRPQSA